MTLLIKSFPSYHPNYLWVLFMGLQRTLLSLHLVIFEKGSMTLLIKSFPSYHPIYLSVFIFGVAEKGYNKP
jgi:hypothetical protein